MAKKDFSDVDDLVDKIIRCRDNNPFGELLKRSKVLSVINTPAGLTIHFSIEGIHHISYWSNDGEFIKDDVLMRRLDFEAYIEAQEILDNKLMEFSSGNI
jgi:hypothetical protein